MTTTTTRAQRVALKRVFDRHPIVNEALSVSEPVHYTYLQWRRTVLQGWDCLMVEWCGMWLGIEKDGYTHS